MFRFCERRVVALCAAVRSFVNDLLCRFCERGCLSALVCATSIALCAVAAAPRWMADRWPAMHRRPPSSPSAHRPQLRRRPTRREPPADDRRTSHPGRVEQRRVRPGPATRAVRSGLAHTPQPGAGEPRRLRLRASGGSLFRDPLALFLLLASIGLAIAFALLLGSIKPSSSGRRCRSARCRSSPRHHQIATALLLDHDNRVELSRPRRHPRSRPTARSAARAPKAATATGRCRRARSTGADSPKAPTAAAGTGRPARKPVGRLPGLRRADPAAAPRTVRRRRDRRASISSRARRRRRSSSSS